MKLKKWLAVWLGGMMVAALAFGVPVGTRAAEETEAGVTSGWTESGLYFDVDDNTLFISDTGEGWKVLVYFIESYFEGFVEESDGMLTGTLTGSDGTEAEVSITASEDGVYFTFRDEEYHFIRNMSIMEGDDWEDDYDAFRGDEMVEQQEVWDEDGFTVTVNGLGIVEGTPVLWVIVENNSGSPVHCGLVDVAVNDWQWNVAMVKEDIDGLHWLYDVELADGAEDMFGIDLSDGYYARYTAITAYEKIGFALEFTDEEFRTVADTPILSVETSAAEDYEDTFVEAGYQAYEKDGVRVTFLGQPDESIMPNEVLACVTNDSDQKVYIWTNECEVNGVKGAAWFGTILSPHTRQIVPFSVEFEVGFISMLKAELAVERYDTETYEMAQETETVHICEIFESNELAEYYDAMKVYLVDELDKYYDDYLVAIPYMPVIGVDDTDPEDIRIWGDYWLTLYKMAEDEENTLVRSGGGHFPGLMHLKKAADGYVVTAFDEVASGAGHDESLKEIFGDLAVAENALSADEESREAILMRRLAEQVAANEIEAQYVMDYGMDPVPLFPEMAEE